MERTVGSAYSPPGEQSKRSETVPDTLISSHLCQHLSLEEGGVHANGSTPPCDFPINALPITGTPLDSCYCYQQVESTILILLPQCAHTS